jgi:TonB family protein
MERAEEDLSQVLPDRPLTAVEGREMLVPTLSALEYLHRQGLVHAHLKPSNIMAVEDHLKISSDGLNDRSVPTPYDPPEQGLSAAGDIWSLGITLVEVLTQRLPSNGIAPDLPEPFAEIARGSLKRNAADRITIPQISNLLTPSGSPAIPRKRRRLPVGVFILLALVVITVAGVIFMHSETGTPAPAPQAPEVVKTPEPQPPPPQLTPEPKRTAKATKPPVPEPKSEPAPEPASAAPVSGIVSQPLPEITDQARNTIHGKVKFNIKVDVSPSGAVTDAKIETSDASKYFGERALAAVRQWKFEPVSANGSQVGQRWRVRFEFLKSGTKVQPQRVAP